MTFMQIAVAALAIAVSIEAPIGPSQAFEQTSVVGECQRCLDDLAKEQQAAGKNVKVTYVAGLMGCLVSGPAVPVCLVSAGVAAEVTRIMTEPDNQRCAVTPACKKMEAALAEKTKTNCELPDSGKKNMVRTLTICRNGFGTTVAISCNASHAGTPSSSAACSNLRCPTSNNGC